MPTGQTGIWVVVVIALVVMVPVAFQVFMHLVYRYEKVRTPTGRRIDDNDPRAQASAWIKFSESARQAGYVHVGTFEVATVATFVYTMWHSADSRTALMVLHAPATARRGTLISLTTSGVWVQTTTLLSGVDMVDCVDTSMLPTTSFDALAAYHDDRIASRGAIAALSTEQAARAPEYVFMAKREAMIANGLAEEIDSDRYRMSSKGANLAMKGLRNLRKNIPASAELAKKYEKELAGAKRDG